MKRRFSDYVFRSYRKRKFVNGAMKATLTVAAAAAILPLVSVFGYVIAQGFPAISLGFLTELPKPVGESGGGMGNALAGTFTLVVMASTIGIPWGVAVGTYLSEYGRGRFPEIVRFSADMLSSVPSIIIGLFVYVAIVLPMKRFSALAGGVALGILMIPTIARSAEELLKLVPPHIREAGLALGLPRWRVILWIVLKGSLGAITTGVMLSIARVAGETAPLIFTAFNNRFWQTRFDQPISSLPVQVFTYAISPYDEWRKQAWAGAFMLVMFVFTLNLLTRFILRGKAVKRT